MYQRGKETSEVLITGSSGMIGTTLMDQLLENGIEVYGADITENQWKQSLNNRTTIVDLTDSDALEQLPRDVDMIVHLAAHARVHQLVKEPDYAMANLEMTFNILDYARRADIPNFLFASSREVYGNEGGMIYSENETSISRSESPYTASKMGGEALVHSYNRCYDLSTAIIRLSNVYGRYDRTDRVIPEFIRRNQREEPLEIYGREKVLDFTYLDDCINGICNVVEDFPKVTGETLNISSGDATSLVELAQTINNLMPYDSEIRIHQSRAGEVKRYIGDISKAYQLLGYQPQYSLEEGLADAVDWYVEQPATPLEAMVQQTE